MTLLRVLFAELLKMKRTIALALVVIAPFAVGTLILFAVAQAPFSMLRVRNAAGSQWMELARLNLELWGALMLPLFITIETALIAGLDHSENQWKILFAAPGPPLDLLHRKTVGGDGHDSGRNSAAPLRCPSRRRASALPSPLC
jgi:hypothetical protein